jgi:hypothetical protein
MLCSVCSAVCCGIHAVLHACFAGPEFRTTALSIQAKCHDVATKILKSLFRGLGWDEARIDDVSRPSRACWICQAFYKPAELRHEEGVPCMQPGSMCWVGGAACNPDGKVGCPSMYRSASLHAALSQMLYSVAQCHAECITTACMLQPFDLDSPENPSFLAWNYYPGLTQEQIDALRGAGGKVPPRLHAHADM